MIGDTADYFLKVLNQVSNFEIKKCTDLKQAIDFLKSIVMQGCYFIITSLCFFWII